MTSLEDARKRADKLNLDMDSEAGAHRLDDVGVFLTGIRGFLLKNDQEEVSNNLHALLKQKEDRSYIYIALGPQTDKGPSNSHYNFDTGARLSFGITLLRDRRKSRLVAYRFHYVFKEGHSPAFIRFDLNPSGERPALEESRCHLHPGSNEVRLPARVLSPLEVLDRVFFVLNKCSCSACI